MYIQKPTCISTVYIEARFLRLKIPYTFSISIRKIRHRMNEPSLTSVVASLSLHGPCRRMGKGEAFSMGGDTLELTLTGPNYVRKLSQPLERLVRP